MTFHCTRLKVNQINHCDRLYEIIIIIIIIIILIIN